MAIVPAKRSGTNAGANINPVQLNRIALVASRVIAVGVGLKATVSGDCVRKGTPVLVASRRLKVQCELGHRRG